MWKALKRRRIKAIDLKDGVKLIFGGKQCFCDKIVCEVKLLYVI